LPYVGRLAVYKKGEANILFVLQHLKELYPSADYDHLTLVGHSNGGDMAMYFAKQHPQLVSKVITLDNLRVPLVLSHKLKILSFRSKDPQFKTDPGVLPTLQEAKADGIDIVQTPFQHTWMSDRGPNFAKEAIKATLNRFLGGANVTRLASINTDHASIANDAMPLP
jgi:pimeloyl-ACP methyl ester carboxylesterase